MSTTVRVQGRLVTLTPDGWKSGDVALDAFCAAAVAGGVGGFQWDVNPSQAEAMKLAAATGGQIESVEPLIDEDLPADTVF